MLQFVAVGVLTAVLLTIATAWFSRRAASDEAIADAEAVTELLARSVVQPAISKGLVLAEPAAVDRFDRLVRGRILGGEVLRIKIWRADGTIVYSDEPRYNGKQFTLDEEELEVLETGSTETEFSDLSDAENRFDQSLGDEVVEVYTSITVPGGEALLFEVYFSSALVSERADSVVSAFRPISVGALLLFLVLSIPLVLVLARRLDAAGRDREALLQAAVDASDVERSRIARDLHDGVVQDLAGTAMALSASSRTAEREDQRARLEGLAGGVRSSLRSLRSLLVDIYPADLHTGGLAAALDDLVAPAVADGIDVRLRVDDTGPASQEAVGLIWRTAQECIRNAVRHGSPESLTVRVHAHEEQDLLVLEVVDDGAGFDPTRTVDPTHFGLRGLRDLAEIAGASLDVRSEPGRGTHVTLEVSPT